MNTINAVETECVVSRLGEAQFGHLMGVKSHSASNALSYSPS